MANYLTLAEGDAFALTILGTQGWDSAEDPEKEQSLTSATKIIDQLKYVGIRAVPTQVNEFPRTLLKEQTGGDILSSTLTTPQDIIDACFYVANELLNDNEEESAFEAGNIKIEKLPSGVMREMFPGGASGTHLNNGIPSIRAWRLILPYLGSPASLTLQRTS